MTRDVYCLPSVPLCLLLPPTDNPFGLGDCCGGIVVVVVEVLWPTHVDRIVIRGDTIVAVHSMSQWVAAMRNKRSCSFKWRERDL